MASEQDNGWDQYRIDVTRRLKEHTETFFEVEKKLSSMEDKLLVQIIAIREDIATLKVKSGVWGLMGGMIPVIIYVFVKLMEESK